jgi:hemerythrin HHE cation binding domain-containing protein
VSAPLPPLPPAFRVRDEDVRPGGRDMIDILVNDHRKLAELCGRLHDAVPAASDPRLRGAGPAAVNGPDGFQRLTAGEQLCGPGEPGDGRGSGNGQAGPGGTRGAAGGGGRVSVGRGARADAVDAGPAAASAVDASAAADGGGAAGSGCVSAGAPGAAVRPVTDVLVATLSRHLSAEEQYLYPTVRAVLPDGTHLADQELVEDEAMVRTLRQLHTTPADDPAFAALVDTLTTQVRRHAERAAQEIFPRLRGSCSDNELIRLGNRVEIAQEAAPTRPHPTTPVTPPANKVIDPAVAVLDKVRDALSGRPTRSEDLRID